MKRWLFALVAVALAQPALAEDAMPPDSVGVVVFEADLLSKTEAPLTIHYTYEMSGETIEPSIHSQAKMILEKDEAEGDKLASFDLFEGPNRRQFGPISASAQNPMILVFLQRDVTQMGNLTGGSAGYFQKGLRQGFRGSGETEAVEVDIRGEKVAAEKVTIKPFENDPQIGRFPQFRDKTYSFWVSDDVPGGLYRIETITPDVETGAVILAESLTFDRAE